MALAVTHSTVATLPDEAGKEVNKAEWNAAHTLTGTASLTQGGTGNTSGTATVNANLTGPVTSVGNATAIANSAITDAMLGLTTPALGTPVSLTLTNATGLPIAGGGTGGTTKPTAQIGIGVREVLTATRTYYVDTGGHDTASGLNAGTNATTGAFLTIQKAINICATLDLGIYDVAVQIADGTYTGKVIATGPFLGAGKVTIQGNNGTPANVLVSVTTDDAITAQSGCYLTVKDLKVETTGSHSLRALSSSHIDFGNIVFGAAGLAHIRADYASYVAALSNYAITSAGALTHMLVNASSTISIAGAVVTLSGTPAFAIAFAYCISSSTIITQGASFSGGATGPRYFADAVASINTAGGGASYFPGNSAGSATNNAVYI